MNADFEQEFTNEHNFYEDFFWQLMHKDLFTFLWKDHINFKHSLNINNNTLFIINDFLLF